jgi:ABC-type polysaccharide/polyol phosphate export permease
VIASGLELFSRYDLLVLLVQKELKLKYKGSVLGIFWSLLNPLLMMAVYALVFSIIFKFTIPRYPVFLLAGLLPWSFFQSSITGSTMSVILNGHLVRRVKFPIDFLPTTTVLANLFNVLPSFAVLLVFTFFYRQPVGLPLLALPLLLALQVVFTIGLGLGLSALTVYFRDLEHLIPIGITVWFYGTPVIYPLSIFAGHPNVHALLLLNPMTWLITAYQDIWHENRWPDPVQLGIFALCALASWIAGTLIFRRLEGRFAEEV